MVINHPLLGPRDASEFVYLGDASLMNRPNWLDKDAGQKFYKYQLKINFLKSTNLALLIIVFFA